MKDCCNNQYLIFNEDGYLQCVNCGAEDNNLYEDELDKILAH